MVMFGRRWWCVVVFGRRWWFMVVCSSVVVMCGGMPWRVVVVCVVVCGSVVVCGGVCDGV